jgi:5-methylcytosine-specific restriction endonuclease McrA
MSTLKEKALKQKLWRSKNKERSKELVTNAKSKKPEKYKQIQKDKYERWKKDKPEQLKKITKRASIKYNLKKPWLISNHKPERKIYLQEWIKNHPENMKIIRKRAKAKRRGVEGSYTLNEWENLKIQYGYSCPSCFRHEPQIELHADHIIPIIKGGSNYIENIQPLCKSCNSSKYTKIIRFNIPNEISQ